MSYKLTRYNTIIRLLDNAIIPKDETNLDYIAYLNWLDSGGVPEPEDPLPEYEDWRQFFFLISDSSAFSMMRELSKVNIEINALSTELRACIGEAAMGFVNSQTIQELVNMLVPLLTQEQIDELQQIIEICNISLILINN